MNIPYFKQPSTWNGFAQLAGALGIFGINPNGWTAIASAITGVIGAVNIIRNERR